MLLSRFTHLILSLIFICFIFLFPLGNTNTALADLTTENFASSVTTCIYWDNASNFFGPPDSKYATITNKIPVCTFSGFSPFNIPTDSTINALIVRVYNSPSGNSGVSSMSPAYNADAFGGGQLCIPPPFFPATIYNNMHEYIVTAANCPNTFPTLNQLNSGLMGWQFYNSGNITASMDAISMQVTYASQPTPGPIPFLDLPWDYEGKGLSFNEGALAINSYFDHEYPLLSSGLSEPPTASDSAVIFQGPERTNNWYSSHDGYDYGIPAKVSLGEPVLAAASGSAVYVDSCKACGNMLIIDHGNGYQTRYLHLQKDGLIIATTSGSIKVNSRQQIGLVGVTGNNTTGAHIHFGIFQDKNKDGNFIDNVPDGVTDPYGWQSKSPDPWETYSFFYNGLERTGNKSYYLWKHQLDSLDDALAANGGVFSAGRYTVDIPQDATNQNLSLKMQSFPNVKVSDSLVSIGSAIHVTATDAFGNLVILFTKPLVITIDFTQFDLSRFKTSTISIYSSADRIHWVKEESFTDYLNKKSTAVVNHLTYFALMAERIDTITPTTTAITDGQEGKENWFRSDVAVSLNPQDNTNGLGVGYTLYKIEDGENATDWTTYKTPVTFIQEGHHKIEFYSVDKDENIENAKSIEFDIDKTTPEAKVFIDQDKKNVVLEGIDANQTTVEKYDAVYIISDLAGNILQLNVKGIDTKKKDTLSIYSIAYNQETSTQQPDNYYTVTYKGKKNKLKIDEQNFAVKGEVKIKIKYDASKNQSSIITKKTGEGKIKEIKNGLVLLQLATENGKLKYNY